MSQSTRRTFLAAAASAPAIFAANKSGSKNPILGEGAHQYEAIHDWGELPANIKYGNTHGVVEDSNGFLYVHHTVNDASESSDTMVVFDPKGKFVKSWGAEFKKGAHGLTINKEGKQDFLYLCDTRRAVVAKYTTKGEKVWEIAGPPKDIKEYAPGEDGKPKKYSPTNLAIAPNGDVYVGDGYGSSFVNVYDSKGQYKFTFGGVGSDAGKLNCPHGITIDTRSKDPIVTVADRTNKRLQRFTLEGKHIDFVNGVSAPCHFHERKGLIVIPDLDARVTVLDQNNKVLVHLGAAEDPKQARTLRTKAREEFVPGKFICPHGACFDHKGNIFVTEWVEVGRVTKLRKV
jgi:DNA-binding beta-propeller fold protein YncE